MRTTLTCLPCLSRNALAIAEKITPDPALRQAIVRAGFRHLAGAELSQPPPYHAWRLQELAQKLTNHACPDPYIAVKDSSTRLAQQLLGELPKIPNYAPGSFESRLRLAIAGNILDFGIFVNLDIAKALETVKLAFDKPVDSQAVARLQARMEAAQSILYILDNCGEAVFDRVFLEPYRAKITLAVRGRPAINDVTMAELKASGLEHFTHAVVANASGVPGTLLSLAGAEFNRAFNAADLVIAKGQGNFETLNETRHPIAYLFMVKCPVIAELLGAHLESLQVLVEN